MSWVSRVIFSCLLCLGFSAAHAQEAPPTVREQELLEKLDAVLKRLDVVEQDLATMKAQQQAAPAEAATEAVTSAEFPSTTLEDRIAELEEERDSTLKTVWKEGLRFESRDGAFKAQLGGRVWADYGWIDQDRELQRDGFDEQSGGQFRTVRLDLKGEIYDNVIYRIEYDIAGNNGPAGFTDTYVGLRDIPYVGTLTLGHFKEPFSLEELVSDNFYTFLERAQTTALTPSRNFGLQLSSAFFGETKQERMTYAVGAFQNTDNWPSTNDADEDQGVAITGRVSGLPWYAEEGRKLLHLGAAYSHRNPDGAVRNPYEIRPFPESRLVQFRWLDTEGYPGFTLGAARPDDVDLYGLEAALVYGPFSVQGEYMLSKVDTTFGGDLSFDGYYAQASYFVTGEHRRYKNETGVFDRIRPNRNFGWGKGPGAWELAARYSSMDLDDTGVNGGKEHNLTLGVNWYLNPNTRLMLNYTLADIEHPFYDGKMAILQTRFQVDF